jgi:PBP1b-binding outer membrane lipoprotein LpoB
MKKLLLILVIASVSLTGCTRNSVDSEVKDGDPGYIDSPNEPKRDSTHQNPIDSAGPGRPDSVLPHG